MSKTASCLVCQQPGEADMIAKCASCAAQYHAYCFTGCTCGEKGCKKKPNLMGRKAVLPEGDWYCKFCRSRPEKSECAASQQVYAFGCNVAGQLGLGELGEESNKTTPTLVKELDGVGVSTIALGGWNTVLLASDGKVYTCGDGDSGKTGHQDVVHEHISHFRNVITLLGENRSMSEGDIVQLNFGRDFGAATTSEGHMYTWGNGGSGQLGHQELTNKKAPKKISALREKEIPISMVVACGAAHIVALGSEYKELFSWGENKMGQLGTGNGRNQWVPQILNPSRPTDIYSGTSSRSSGDEGTFDIKYNTRGLACGNMHSLALTADGRVWSWGGATSGQLGQGDTETKSDFGSVYRHLNRPAIVPFFRDNSIVVTLIASGSDHVMCSTSTDTLYAWGANQNGQLGVGDENERRTPTEVKLDKSIKVSNLALGSAHSLALTQSGQVYACGSNAEGQLGLGDKVNRAEFTLVKFGDDSLRCWQAFAGGDHSFLVCGVGEEVKLKKKAKAVTSSKKRQKKQEVEEDEEEEEKFDDDEEEEEKPKRGKRAKKKTPKKPPKKSKKKDDDKGGAEAAPKRTSSRKVKKKSRDDGDSDYEG